MAFWYRTLHLLSCIFYIYIIFFLSPLELQIPLAPQNTQQRTWQILNRWMKESFVSHPVILDTRKLSHRSLAPWICPKSQFSWHSTYYSFYHPPLFHRIIMHHTKPSQGANTWHPLQDLSHVRSLQKEVSEHLIRRAKTICILLLLLYYLVTFRQQEQSSLKNSPHLFSLV